MNEFLTMLLKVVLAAVGTGSGWLLKLAISYVKRKLDIQDQNELENLVEIFVNAAEQNFYKEDETGQTRLTFVQEMLQNAGYEITESISALIESKVYQLNAKKRAERV